MPSAPPTAGWSVWTPVAGVWPIPPGAKLVAPGSHWPFEFEIGQGVVLFQGPFAKVSPADLAAPGQSVAAKGSVKSGAGEVQWYEFGYEHEGTAWAQRHFLLPAPEKGVLIMTLQVPTSGRDEALPIVLKMVTGYSM